MTHHQTPLHPNGDRAQGDLSCHYAGSDDHPWIAFDIIKEDSCHLKYRAVIALLGCADERYDLNLGNGFMLARGIFSELRDPGLLADLLVATNKWREKAVYVSGDNSWYRKYEGDFSVNYVISTAERDSVSARFLPGYPEAVLFRLFLLHFVGKEAPRLA